MGIFRSDVVHSKPRDGAGGTLLFPCSADGKKAKGVSAGALDAQGAEGSHVVLGFAYTVSGYLVEARSE